MLDKNRIPATEFEVARCPSLSVQDIIRNDGDQAPAMAQEHYRFLGNEDIPFERYTTRDFYELEMKSLWTKTWQWACREEHIPAPGDYYVYDIGKYSVLVVRTQSGDVRGYINSCLHRGTKLKPSASEGHTKELRCPFHGWSWDLDGKLKHLPCEWDFQYLDQDKHQLPQVKVGIWGGFVFINLGPEAMPLEEYLEVLPEHARSALLEERYVATHIEKELPCNWKIASEAFLESYHVLETHPQMMPANGDINSQYDIFGDHVNRVYVANGVKSPNITRDVSEQELLDAMLVGDGSGDGERLMVPPGMTARQVMADQFRRNLQEQYGIDSAALSTTEVLDTIGYFVFPNGHFFLGLAFPIAYRFRPLGDDHQKCLFDVLVLQPLKKGESRPEPAMPVRIKVDESYTQVPGLSAQVAHILDQDTNNMLYQQEGMATSRKAKASLATYQEVRIRHIHQVIDKYLGLQG